MLDQDICKAALTDFAISKWSRGIDKLIFSSTLKQRLASIAMQIVFINDLCKEFSLAYNLNTSSLRAYTQGIIRIL